MNHSYEIEIKSLLGNKENAEKLLEKMKSTDPNLRILGSHKQLNHYFIPTPVGSGRVGGDLKTLYDNVKNLLNNKEKSKLKDLSEKAKDFSVRTRDADGKVILVVKASVDDTTSSNGTARLEFESVMEKLTLNELDKLILNSGFAYQAKWSRERSEYIFHYPLSLEGEGQDEGETNVSIDENAGYGYLAEFEKVIDDESKASEVKEEIRKMMAELEVSELPQDRLARMFDFYNQNWKDYYGTDKIFNIE